MKRCPDCRRDYHDETLNFCLDDGTRLLEGPYVGDADTVRFLRGGISEAVTRNLPGTRHSSPETRHSSTVISRIWSVAVLGLAVIGIGTWYLVPRSGDVPISESTVSIPDSNIQKLYWEMSDSERDAFIVERSGLVQQLIGGGAEELDKDAISAIRGELEFYVERRASLSQEPFEEGLRSVYGRATQFVPVIARSFAANKVPPVIGIYQAMIESEYHDCPEPDGALVEGKPPVGLFQFSRKTANLYGLKPEDYCNVTKQSDAAARMMSDLVSDFGSDGSAWTLALLSFNQGPEGVREQLRELRAKGTTQRSYWIIRAHRAELKEELGNQGLRYVPRFFAAAIIGETPGAFDLPTPPLSSL